jgi:DNA sulfur modification protein DndD
MRITKIKMLNYRQYKEMNFNFSKKNKHDLHIIIAKNGIGKTNFLNAITWCLYDKELHLGIKSKALPILNNITNNVLKVNDETRIEVEMTIKNSTRKLVVKRTMVVRKVMTKEKDNDLFYNNSDIKVLLYDDISKVPKTYESNNASELINKHFPEGIRDHFFFDNEQLSKFFQESNNDNVRQAIHQISQIEYLQEIKRKMNEVLYGIRKEASNNAPELEKLHNELISTNEAHKNASSTLQTLLEEFDKAKNDLKNVQSQLQNTPNIKELYDELEELIESKKTALNRKKVAIGELNNFLKSYVIKMSLYENSNKLLKMIEDQRTKGEIPIDISRTVLEESLMKNKCFLCSAELTEKHINHIKREIQKRSLLSNDKGGFLLGIENELRRIILDVKNYKSTKKKFWKNYEEEEQIVEKIDTQIDEIKKSLEKRTDTDNLKKLYEEEEDLSEMVNDLRDNKIPTARLNKKTLYEESKKAKAKYDRALENSKKGKKLNQLVLVGEKLSNFTEKVKNSLVDEIRKDIRDITMDGFNEFVWKKKTYSSVEIDSNYSVDLIHKNGYSCIGSCSAAERSLLALAFTIAVHKSSNSNAPLVIDSPVGRISDVNRENFAKSLRDVSQEKQLIMIFTPSEYSDEVKGHLDGVCATKNTLIMNEEENHTFMEGQIYGS